MKKMTQIATAVALATAVAMPAMAAEGEGNVSLTSNYLWRGMTQTSDGAALQAGYDWTAGAWSYGIWASNVTGAAEYDLYGAYSGGSDDAGYSIGYLRYGYTAGIAAVQEVSLGGHYGALSGTYYYDLGASAGYTELGYDISDFTINYGTGSALGSYTGVSYSKTVSGYDVGLTVVNHSVNGTAYALSVGTTF